MDTMRRLGTATAMILCAAAQIVSITSYHEGQTHYLFEDEPVGVPVFTAGVGPGAGANSGTLHPIFRELANPTRLTIGDVDGVREQSRYLANKSFNYAERRLAERGWWLGTTSIVDVYLNGAFSVARNAKFNTALVPQLDALGSRLADALPAFRAIQAEESASRALLDMAA